MQKHSVLIIASQPQVCLDFLTFVQQTGHEFFFCFSVQGDHLCSECGKGFFGADKLAAHIQTHGERNVQCPDCPAAFTTKRLLNFHREIHNPVKIKCNACPKILRSRGALQRHISESMTSAETHFTLHTKLVYDCTQTSRFVMSDKMINLI